LFLGLVLGIVEGGIEVPEVRLRGPVLVISLRLLRHARNLPVATVS